MRAAQLVLFAALPINSMDGILPNTLSDSVTGGGLFDIVNISSGSNISFSFSFDIGAVVSGTFNGGYQWVLTAPIWFTKPSSIQTIKIPIASYNTVNETPYIATMYIDLGSIGGGDTTRITVIFYKKR